MNSPLALVYVQFFCAMALAAAFAWMLMASPIRIAPKASKLFSITNLCMFIGMMLYYFRSDTINYLYWYGADFIYLVGYCCLRWGGQSIFKQPLSISFDLTIVSITTLCMFLFPPQQEFASYLMVIACLGAFIIFSCIVFDTYHAVRKNVSVFYTSLITLPFAFVSLFFIAKAVSVIIFIDNQQLSNELTTLNSSTVSWLNISFLFTINCMLFANVLTSLILRIRELANKDQLTGVWNRHALLAHLKLVDNLWKRNQICFSLIMLDLDRFKKINDSFGHLAGDAALKHVANLLKNTLREVDFICRYGGRSS
ncbi:GGDEF domain-containing protein [Shewanella aestuarii]|uniref:diguanylate cyclase n=1 Tax=Shewanella aestuarii TaxID=1028752 RepID=A0A6G9QF25_9GAMM|nr:GGDEF domain-containing protein [Shewanella aestuarii]QIR13144.1 GGDEF domain-containing protein [Shewanella aestuarii]